MSESELLNTDIESLLPDTPMKDVLTKDGESPNADKIRNVFDEDELAEKKEKAKRKGLEIAPDRTKEFWTVERKRLVKGIKEWEIEEICNHKKEYDKEAMFLIRYNTGQRDWCLIEPCVQECPDLVLKYVTEHLLTWNALGYSGPYPGLYQSLHQEKENDNERQEKNDGLVVKDTNVTAQKDNSQNKED